MASTILNANSSLTLSYGVVNIIFLANRIVKVKFSAILIESKITERVLLRE